MQRAITLVSRRWHRLFYSEPGLWRSLSLTALSNDWTNLDDRAWRRLAAYASLLPRIGSFAQQLRFSQELFSEDEHKFLSMQELAPVGGGGWRLSSSVLAHLSCYHFAWIGWLLMQPRVQPCSA